MNKGKRKAVHYARAIITPKTEKRTLQKLLDDTYSHLKTAVSRTHQFQDGISIQTRYYNKRSRTYGSQFHLVAFTSDEPTTIVPRPTPRQVDAELDELQPPTNADYMDGEALLLVHDNHVLICSAGQGISDSKVAQFFEQLVVSSGVSHTTVSLFLSRVADVNTLKLIARHGVKALALNASMDEAGLLNTNRTSARKTMLGGVVDSFTSLLFKDGDDPDEEEARAHLDAEVTIKVDRWGRGKLSQGKLDELAKLALEETEGVRVILTDDTVITGDRIATHKYFTIAHKAKGMFRADALAKIDTYFGELKADGYFD